jgi:hypothetical protein
MFPSHRKTRDLMTFLLKKTHVPPFRVKRNSWNVRSIIPFLIAMLGISSYAAAQAFNGYTLFCPGEGSMATYLINMKNATVHSWTHNKSGGYSVYLLDDGSILRTVKVSNAQLNGGGATGVVQRTSWSGSILWEYTYSSSTHLSHHDIKPMPNGNVLMIAWEVKTAAQAVQAGLKRSTVIWPDHLIEVKPTGTSGGNIVWEWHAWDHLVQDYDASKSNYGVVAAHPELLNINMGGSGVGPMGGDWMHINAVSYNPILDQIVISSHTLNEIYVIDHSTTTAEAAGHSGGRSGKGGDILYRWGMPSNYGAPGTKYFDVVHCAVWIPQGLPGEGHIMAMNNGDNQRRSVAVELETPVDAAGNYLLTTGQAYAPALPIWSYTAADFYTDHLGSVQRLPNGNTLIVESTSGNLFEVNAAGTIQWSYNRGGQVVRALRYALDYPGVSGLTDAGESPSSLPVECTLQQNFPNPFNHRTTISYTLPKAGRVSVKVYNALGAEIATLDAGLKEKGVHDCQFDARAAGVSPGLFYCRLIAGETTRSITLLITE